MIKGVEHIAVFSKDSKALCDWYVNVLGFTVVYNNGKGTYFVAMEDKMMIEICKAEEDGGAFWEKTAGIRHIAFTCDDFEKTVEELKAKNVEIVADVSVSGSGVKTFFFKDLDGNIHHLIARPKPLI